MVGLIRIPKPCNGDLLQGSWTLCVSGVGGVQGFLVRLMAQRSKMPKVLKVFKRFQDVWCRSLKGSRVNYEVSRSPHPRPLPHASGCPNITQFRPECLNGTEDPISASMIQRDQRSTGSRVSRDRGFPPLYPAPLGTLT